MTNLHWIIGLGSFVGGLSLMCYSSWSIYSQKEHRIADQYNIFGIGKAFFLGLIFMIFGLVELVGKISPVDEKKFIGISSCFFGIVFLFLSLFMIFSRKFNELFFSLIGTKNLGLDRKLFISLFLPLAFGCLFGFYVFYWG